MDIVLMMLPGFRVVILLMPGSYRKWSNGISLRKCLVDEAFEGESYPKGGVVLRKYLG